MGAVSKQDSNFTELRVAVETAPGVVDGSVTWEPREPNSYKTFGGDVKTKARMPINSSRQLKKGTVVDLDAPAGWQEDLTPSNFQSIGQSVFFAALRKKSEVAVATVDGTANKYQPASGGDGYVAGDLLFAKGLDDDANNGLKLVNGTPDATNVPVTDTGLVTASTQSGIISRVGYQFGIGEASIDVSGTFPKLVVTGSTPAAAAGDVLTASTNFSNGDVVSVGGVAYTFVPHAAGTLTLNGTDTSILNGSAVVIGGKTYTFKTALTPAEGEVLIGGSDTAALTNLFNALNHTGTPGTDYSVAAADANVVAFSVTATVLVVKAKALGSGAATATTTTVTGASWAAGTLTGGGADTADRIAIGTNLTSSLAHLRSAINDTGSQGFDYGDSTSVNPQVTSTTSNATTITVAALVAGAAGNSIAATVGGGNVGNGAWATALLTGGMDATGARSFTSMGLIPGSYVFIGSDEANTAFVAGSGAANGYARIRKVLGAELWFDKTQNTMVTDVGAGKNIRIYYGRVLKNEKDVTLIVKRGLQLERALGAPDDAQPTQIQGEYLTRALPNDWKLDFKTADIVRYELDFVCNANELVDGPTGLKAGTRPALQDEDAFNATSDVVYTKVAVVTPGNASPTPLVSYFTDLVLTLKNNIKQNKAVSVLGAFDSTVGFFQVGVDITAYFTNVAEMSAVKENKSVTIETHLFKFNKGISIDVPLVAASKAMADVKINEAIMLPLSTEAATAKLIDTALDHTLLMQFWDFLPDLAG